MKQKEKEEVLAKEIKEKIKKRTDKNIRKCEIVCVLSFQVKEFDKNFNYLK